jgi:hypothetical protein
MASVRSAQCPSRLQPGPLRLPRRGWPLAAFLWLAGAGAAIAASADPAYAPSWLELDTRLSVSHDALQPHGSSVVRPPDAHGDYSLASAHDLASWRGLTRVPTLIDVVPLPLAASEPQAYYRPQFALGESSESLRSWLRVAGLNASSCMAPLMRMHSSFAGSNAHAKVSISARCRVH